MKELTPEQHHIIREKGTEPAFSGQYWDHDEDGTYHCVGCGAPLFDARDKYDSGSGWPSFCRPAADAPVGTADDRSFHMRRTEALCAKCGAHLGHVFDDGPAPTGQRYCINSLALDFEPREEPPREESPREEPSPGSA